MSAFDELVRFGKQFNGLLSIADKVKDYESIDAAVTSAQAQLDRAKADLEKVRASITSARKEEAEARARVQQAENDALEATQKAAEARSAVEATVDAIKAQIMAEARAEGDRYLASLRDEGGRTAAAEKQRLADLAAAADAARAKVEREIELAREDLVVMDNQREEAAAKLADLNAQIAAIRKKLG